MPEPWVVIRYRGHTPGAPLAEFREAAGGFTPTFDPSDDASIITAITAALRFDRHVARDYSPGLSPRITVDEALWYRIHGHFSWVPKSRIAPVPKPEINCGLQFAVRFARVEKNLVNSVCDVRGRPIPEVFEAAALEASKRIDKTPRFQWPEGVKAAAYEWLLRDFPELAVMLRGVPPIGVRRYQDAHQLRTRLGQAWARAGCPKTRDFSNTATLLRYLERVGALKPGHHKRYLWGPVWKSGLTDGVTSEYLFSL